MIDPAKVSIYVSALALALPRILMTLMLLPFFARQNNSGFLRTAIAFAFALPAVPGIVARVNLAVLDTGTLLLLVMKETAIGVILGFALAIPFWATEGIGFVIDNQRGASTNNITNSLTGDESSPLGVLVSQAYFVLFLMLGGMTLTLGLIYQSYGLWAVDAPLPRFDPEFARHFLGLLDTLLRTAIVLAGPIMVCMLLAEIALAIVSLFAPQMQVFFLAMPIKSGIALFILTIYFPTLLKYMETSVTDISGLLAILHRLMP